MTVKQTGVIGTPVSRVDGRLKVTGAARYAADFPVGNPAYAFLVTSPIAKGTIRGFELGEARAVPGVLEILTYENAGKLKPAEFTGSGGTATTTIQPLASPRFQESSVGFQKPMAKISKCSSASRKS